MSVSFGIFFIFPPVLKSYGTALSIIIRCCLLDINNNDVSVAVVNDMICEYVPFEFAVFYSRGESRLGAATVAFKIKTIGPKITSTCYCLIFGILLSTLKEIKSGVDLVLDTTCGHPIFFFFFFLLLLLLLLLILLLLILLLISLFKVNISLEIYH